MLFKSSKRNKKILENTFDSIEKRLSKLDFELAKEYLNWLERKTVYLESSVNKKSYLNQPKNLNPGDIVWVEFGINVGTELSDYKTKGHYALVINVSLGNVVVIPLSKSESVNSLYIDLGIIDELSDGDKKFHSILKVDAIRSVSKRRIGKIKGVKEGKVTLDKDLFEEVKIKIEDVLFDK